MSRPPAIRVPGVGSIPSGYLVGRVSPGVGDAELLTFAQIAVAVSQSGQVQTATIGAPGAMIIANNRVLGNTSGATAAATAQALTQPAAGLTIAGGSSAFTFALANDLAALEALASTGIAARTGSDTWAQRTIVAPAAGITIADGNGAGGNPTLSLANDLAALEALSSTGIAVRTGSDAWAQRTITGTASRISVLNGSGAAGNPTLDIDAAYVGQTSITTLGTVTTGTWNAGTVSSATDSAGVRPASTTTAGWALRNNYESANEANFWNTVNGAGVSFSWVQKTGAATEDVLAYLYGDGTETSFEMDTNGATTSVTLHVEATFASVQSGGTIPLNFVIDGTTALALPTAGGAVLYGGLLKFLGTTASFPALKRSATILQTRLADDSAYAPFEADTLRTSIARTVAQLPAAGTAGRHAYVTDALAPGFLVAIVGGGAVVTPVFDNGTNWVAY